jgi:hypothetical protein
MREVVGFIQLACALTLGMAGGWAVRQMGLAAIASVRVSRGGCSCQSGTDCRPPLWPSGKAAGGWRSAFGEIRWRNQMTRSAGNGPGPVLTESKAR